MRIGWVVVLVLTLAFAVVSPAAAKDYQITVASDFGYGWVTVTANVTSSDEVDEHGQVRPFTRATNYMSLIGYTCWVMHQSSQTWPPRVYVHLIEPGGNRLDQIRDRTTKRLLAKQ